MAYKRYIKKGDKIYGPYIYHSKKKDGKVVSVYIGKKSEVDKKNKLLMGKYFAIGLIGLVFVLLCLFNFDSNLVGKATLLLEDNNLAGEQVASLIYNDAIADEAVTGITGEVIDETAATKKEKKNVTKIKENVTKIDETIVDTAGEIADKSTTKKPKKGVAKIIKKDVTNIDGTATEITEEIINDTEGNLSVLSIQTTREGVVINRPVKWKKNVKVDKERLIRVEIPKEAENVTVYKVTENASEEVNDSVGEIITEDLNEFWGESKKDVKFKNKTRVREKVTVSVISGRATLDVERVSFFDFFKNVFSFITGRVIGVEETQDIKEVVIDENWTEFEIEYETPGPFTIETNTSKGKRIVVSSEIHYENILAYTDLPFEIPESAVKLYHVVNGTKVLVNFQGYLDGVSNVSEVSNVSSGKQAGGLNKSNAVKNFTESFNNLNQSNKSVEGLSEKLINYIEWIVPHLSNQTYELEIAILNVQSYPTVGGNWTVRFNTTGEADLMVSAFNGTTFGFERGEDDLVFLELKCGNETKNVSVVINGTEVPYDIYLKKKRIEEIRGLLG